MPVFSSLKRIFPRLADAFRARPLGSKAFSFAIVGLINNVVDAAVFFFFLGYVTGSLVIANVTAWFVSTTCSYIINTRTTFSVESGGKLRLRDYAGFLSSGVVSIMASTVAVVFAATFMPVWGAKCVGIVLSAAINFLMTNFIVFRERKQAHGDP